MGIDSPRIEAAVAELLAAIGEVVVMPGARAHIRELLGAGRPLRAQDLAPLALFATAPQVLVVHPSIPANSAAELIAHLKANPDKYTFASSGIGTSTHLAGELFRSAHGIGMRHVPYKGNALAIVDVAEIGRAHV